MRQSQRAAIPIDLVLGRRTIEREGFRASGRKARSLGHLWYFAKPYGQQANVLERCQEKFTPKYLRSQMPSEPG